MAFVAFNSITEHAEEFGLIAGPSGPHSSRTMTLDDLRSLLDSVPADAEFADYQRAVIDENLLGKSTESNRRGSLRRLRELYSLDRTTPLFRVFRTLWEKDSESASLLAFLVAYARDPLLRATASAVLITGEGSELVRQSVCKAIDDFTDGRMNESTIDKVARNASSSWSQAGHLVGRVRKVRTRVEATPVSVAFALLLGYVMGLRGKPLLRSEFIAVLDAPEDIALARSIDARRLGLITLRESQDVFDVGFGPMLTDRELRIANGTN
ncbi:MAG: hypothetical protein ACE361_13250 [Aureliella sp.]